MKSLLLSLVLLAFFSVTPSSGFSSRIRLSTIQPEVVAISDVQNYAAILVEGAALESRQLLVVEGPGQVTLDSAAGRWLWSWQPGRADIGRSFLMLIRDLRSKQECKFVVSVNAFVEDRNVSEMKRQRFFSGIPTTFRVKQVGLDGAYRTTLLLDGKVYADSAESALSVKPDFQSAVGKQAQLKVEYSAPLTNKWVTLAQFSSKVAYPPFRVPGSMESEAGMPLFFHAALGVPPNFYTTLQQRFLLVKSDGFFEDTAHMVSHSITPDNDPFSMFSTIVKRDSGSTGGLGFEFGLRPTEKWKTITDKRGQVIDVVLVDPVTKQENTIQVWLFPRYVQTAIQEEN